MNKATTSTQHTPAKKRHDVGLSDKERIFVHALRDLFDPKGKSTVNVPTRKALWPNQRTQDDRGDTHRRQTGQVIKTRRVERDFAFEHLPPVSAIPKKWAHPASKRIRRRAGKVLVEEIPRAKRSSDSAAKPGPKKPSPSRQKRTEKRAMPRRESLKKPSSSGFATQSNATIRADKAREAEKADLKDILWLGDALPSHRFELEVISAFGGRVALFELCKFERRRNDQARNVFWTIPNKREWTSDGWSAPAYFRRERVLAKATEGMSGSNFGKSRLFHTWKVLGDPGVEKVKKTDEPLESGKQVKKVKKTPSQVRREKRRAEGRAVRAAWEAKIPVIGRARAEAMISLGDLPRVISRKMERSVQTEEVAPSTPTKPIPEKPVRVSAAVKRFDTLAQGFSNWEVVKAREKAGRDVSLNDQGRQYTWLSKQLIKLSKELESEVDPLLKESGWLS